MISPAQHPKNAVNEDSPAERQPRRLLVRVWKYIAAMSSRLRPTIDKKTAKVIKQLLVPFDVGHTKARLGSDKDGGYVLSTKVLRSVKRVYSLGISNDCYIDLLLASQGKSVYQYDMNFCATPTHPNMRFKQLFMDAQALEQELKESGGFNDGENMLLMDIEGGEYDIVLNSSDLLRNFSQICLELHSVLTNKNIKALLGCLNQSHTLIHIHANNWVFWPGYKSYTGHSGIKHELPDLLELTYVRNDTFATKRMSKEKSPTPIDKKNIPNFCEVEMGWWCQ